MAAQPISDSRILGGRGAGPSRRTGGRQAARPPAAALRILAAMLATWGAACTSQGPPPEAFGCPAELETDETEGGQPVSYKFRYVSFFDGDPAELADLAPEEGGGPGLDQIWRFEEERSRALVMVCRYHDTDRTVVKEVPAAISECRLKGEIDEAGEIAGSPDLACR